MSEQKFKVHKDTFSINVYIKRITMQSFNTMGHFKYAQINVQTFRKALLSYSENVKLNSTFTGSFTMVPEWFQTILLLGMVLGCFLSTPCPFNTNPPDAGAKPLYHIKHNWMISIIRNGGIIYLQRSYAPKNIIWTKMSYLSDQQAIKWNKLTPQWINYCLDITPDFHGL